MTNEQRLAKLYGVKGLPLPLPSDFLDEIDYWYYRAVTIEPRIDRQKVYSTILEMIGWR